MGRAKKGEAVNPAAISGMITMLRYQANNCKDPEKKEAGSQALQAYQSLSEPAERAAFLKEFEENGGGKKPGSLKFALTFKQRLSEQFQTEVSATEDYYTRPERERERGEEREGGFAVLGCPRASCAGGSCEHKDANP